MIRLGLVGCGNIAQGHTSALADLPPDARVTATVDIDRDKAEAAATALGADGAVTDFRDVLGDVDAVLLEARSDKYLARETLHFLDCIRSGERPLTDGRRGPQSLRVIWWLYDAEQRGVVADLRGLGLDE